MMTLNRIRLLPRAVRVSHYRRKARDAEHIAWAAGLLVSHPVPAGEVKAMSSNITGAAERMWTFDPFDGFPYPPVKD